MWSRPLALAPSWMRITSYLGCTYTWRVPAPVLFTNIVSPREIRFRETNENFNFVIFLIKKCKLTSKIFQRKFKIPLSVLIVWTIFSRRAQSFFPFGVYTTRCSHSRRDVASATVLVISWLFRFRIHRHLRYCSSQTVRRQAPLRCHCSKAVQNRVNKRGSCSLHPVCDNSIRLCRCSVVYFQVRRISYQEKERKREGERERERIKKKLVGSIEVVSIQENKRVL